MAELVVCLLVAEVVFYYSHRILHHRWSDLHLHTKIKFVMFILISKLYIGLNQGTYLGFIIPNFCVMIGPIYMNKCLHRLYKHIHKIHHGWTSPIALTAYNAHPGTTRSSQNVGILYVKIVVGLKM